jgi:hypothetical protein
MTLAGALVAPVLMAVIIHRYGVNVPYWDEWDQLAVVTDAYDHKLSAGMLWAQQNEHRPVVAKLISIVIARTTDLNLVAEMYLGFGFQCLTLVLIWRMLAAGLRDKAPPLIGPLTVAASLMLFWTVGHEDWVWGLPSVQFFSSVFLAVFGVWAMARWRDRWPGLVLMSAATAVAIFDTGCGFALVGVGILGILGYGAIGHESPPRRTPWRQLLAFVIVSAGCTAVYLRGYVSPGYSATSLARLGPLKMARYFATYVGSPFWIATAAYRSCLLFGAAGIVTMAAACWYLTRHARRWTLAALPWMLLACYTLINAADTAFARVDYGVEQATASRYRPVAILFWISLMTILTMIACEVRHRFSCRVIAAAVFGAIMLFMTGYWYLYYRGFGALTRHSEAVAAGLPYVLNYERATDKELGIYHPTPSTVRALSRKLDQYHLGPFAKTRQSAGGNKADQAQALARKQR